MLSSWTLAFPLLVVTESTCRELNSWVWGSFCKLCILWLASLDHLVQLFTANLYFPSCLKWPLCKCYLKTSADKQQLSFTYPKSEGCGTGSRVLQWFSGHCQFLAIFWHYSADNYQVLSLDFPVRIFENPHCYPSLLFLVEETGCAE